MVRMPTSAETSTLLCRIVGHRRSRRVWHEGDGYRAQCKRCGVDLFKPRGAPEWTTTPFEGG